MPDTGIRAMSAMACFDIGWNRLTGTFPGGGLQAMRAVDFFVIFWNTFTGTLPDGSPQTPLSKFFVDHNHFAGTVPALLRSLNGFGSLDLTQNYFEGSIPMWLNAETTFIGHNRLAGSIPPQLLGGGWALEQKWVVASGLVRKPFV
eukprot:6458394-Amphidinium_carterae.1